MSQEMTSNKKEKKALRDAERQRKGKKRKHDETVEAGESAEQQAEPAKDFIPLAHEEADTLTEAPGSKPNKPKKRKQTEADAGEAVEHAEGGAEAAVSKPKKRKKVSKAIGEGSGEAGDSTEAPQEGKRSKDRFIVFVGNLPYDTTDAALQEHFKKLAPSAVRHRTDPKTKQSKGFAFLEFEGYDRMKTCLKLYHHSMFDPDDYKDPATKTYSRKKSKGPRKINVELTAGGGGKKEGRMEKIRVKNVRLEEQRKRRLELEMKEKANAEKKGAGAKKGAQPAGDEAEANAPQQSDNGGMHPSRLARLG